MGLQLENNDKTLKYKIPDLGKPKLRVYDNKKHVTFNENDFIEEFLKANKAMIIGIANARLGRGYNEDEVMSCAAVALYEVKAIKRKWTLKLQDTSTFHWFLNKHLTNLIGCNGRLIEGSSTGKANEDFNDTLDEFDKVLDVISESLRCNLKVCFDSIQNLKDTRVKKFFEILCQETPYQEKLQKIQTLFRTKSQEEIIAKIKRGITGMYEQGFSFYAGQYTNGARYKVLVCAQNSAEAMTLLKKFNSNINDCVKLNI
jgi:hypothetical protein